MEVRRMMTDIRFGEQHDDSKAKYHIETSDDSKLNLKVGDQHDRSEREVVLLDSGGEQLKKEDTGQDGKTGAIREGNDGTHRLNLILAFVFGVLFLVAILTLVIFIPNPTKPQMQVFSVVLALAAGGFASVLSGMLNVRLNLTSKVAIGATGALAVFVIVYFFVPAMAR
jgi:hypothetical protein